MTEMLTTDTIAAMFGVTRRTVRRWCADGRFANAQAVGGTSNRKVWLVPEGDLLGFEKPVDGAKGDRDE